MTIYFIEMEGEGWLKVGYTAGSAERRMAQLQTGQPQRLKLLGTIPGEMADEKNLHKVLAEYRGNGEWFRFSEDLVETVALLIGKQHPWYYARHKKIQRANRPRMEAAWVEAFSFAQGHDRSAYDVPLEEECLPGVSRQSHDSRRKLRKLGQKIARQTGNFPDWVKDRISGIRGMNPTEEYLAAWASLDIAA